MRRFARGVFAALLRNPKEKRVRLVGKKIAVVIERFPGAVVATFHLEKQHHGARAFLRFGQR